MKTNHDKEIQKALDRGFSGLENIDESEYNAYKVIYESLSVSPEDESLPAGFADDIVLKIERKKDFKALVLLITGIASAFVIFFTAAIALFYYYPSFATGIKTVWEFKVSIIFFLILVSVIQIMDWWLVKIKRMAV